MAYIGQIKDRNGNAVYPKTVISALLDYEPMKVSEPTTLGIAYLNNTYDTGTNSTSYRTIELPNARLVILSVHVKPAVTIDSSNKHHLALLSVPSSIHPIYTQTVVQPAWGGNGAWTTYYDSIGSDGTVEIVIPTTETITANEVGVHAEFFYVARKD